MVDATVPDASRVRLMMKLGVCPNDCPNTSPNACYPMPRDNPVSRVERKYGASYRGFGRTMVSTSIASGSSAEVTASPVCSVDSKTLQRHSMESPNRMLGGRRSCISDLSIYPSSSGAEIEGDSEDCDLITRDKARVDFIDHATKDLKRRFLRKSCRSDASYVNPEGCQIDGVAGSSLYSAASKQRCPFTSFCLGGPMSDESPAMEFRFNLMDLRGREDFRVNYLKKLSYANVWIPKARRPPQHQTISIFDWDDTLLCTSYINLRGDDTTVCTTVANQLTAIEHHGKNLLTTAMRMGRVFLITNAMAGWVEYSARKYLPGLLKTLQSVSVVSARHQFEERFPGDYLRWKIHAFLEVQKTLNSQIITNLISMGDSTIEMEAVRIMGQEFSQALVKTIKFRENPSPDELAKQLELVSQKFEKICLNARNLKIGLERRVIHPRQRGGTTDLKPKSNSNNSMVVSLPSPAVEGCKMMVSSNAVGLLPASSMGHLLVEQIKSPKEKLAKEKSPEEKTPEEKISTSTKGS